MNEFNPGLEVNFLDDKEIERLPGNYGTVYLINKTPWPRSKALPALVSKRFGSYHIYGDGTVTWCKVMCEALALS